MVNKGDISGFLNQTIGFKQLLLTLYIFALGIGLIITITAEFSTSPDREKSFGNSPSFSQPIKKTNTSLINISNSESSPSPAPTIISTPKPRRLDGGLLFNLVNSYRAKNGLNNLVWYHPLCDFAKVRSEQVESNWSHEGFSEEAKGGDLYTSICPECGRTGENLAKDYHSEEAALQAWIGSPSHKNNLDADWDWGCAMYYSSNYVSIIFGKSK